MTRSLLLAALVLSAAAPTAAAAQAPARWRAVPDLRIGGDEPALSQVVSLTLDRSGRIFAADQLGGVIHVYSAEGRHERSFGRAGDGPGEFRRLVRLGWKADTLYAVDTRLQRVTLYAPDGRVARTLRVTSPAFGHFGPSPPLALLPDGTGLAVPTFSTAALTTGAVGQVPLLRLSARGRLLGQLATLSFRDGPMSSVPVPAGEMYLPRPVSGESLWSVSESGDRIVIVHRTAPRSAAPATFQVTTLRSSGDTLASARVRFTPRPISRRLADSLVAVNVKEMSQNARVADMAQPRAVREAFALPPFQPPVTAVVAGRDGTVWLRREALGVQAVDWMVLDARGAVLGTVSLPPEVRVFVAQRDRVWGVRPDEDGVPSLVRYAIRPAP